MGEYRWFTVKIDEADEDGTREISCEGRGELPFADTRELDAGESARIHVKLETDGSFEDVEYTNSIETSEEGADEE